MITEKELLELKDKITEASQKVQQLTGKKEALIEILKEKYQCNTVEDAEAKIEEFRQAIQKINKKIETNIEIIEKNYEFD